MSTLTIHRGDDEDIDVVVTDEGALVDLSDAELTFMVKRYSRDADEDAFVTKTLGDGIILTEADSGEARVTIAAADTADQRAGRYPWELQLVDSDGKVRTLAGGTLHLVADLIRAPEVS